ncbi:MAG: Hsp20/alpha crystallin family protein [Chloroflexi bacterium]|nr:Hsp20/alpha crystallin family protein [Chloroflexota bacterium]
MSMRRWEPLGELMSLREAMDRLFEDSVVRPGRATGQNVSELPIDIYEKDGTYFVTAGVAGMKPEDVEVTVTGNVLTIKGETRRNEEVKRENYLRQERYYGGFTRSIALPEDADASKAEAHFANGLLELRIPKAESAKPKSIKINTSSSPS